MAVKIVTDSTSYIPQEELAAYDISIIALNVVFGDEVIRETDITNEAFYEKLETFGSIPKSSQPSLAEMVETFEGLVRQGHKVLGVFITSKMSGTFSTANLAKQQVLEQYPEAEIQLIESNSNSMELGFVALEAAKMAKEGYEFNEILSHAEALIQRTRYIFAPANLEYLEKGGRIGKAGALIGGILKIVPILTVNDGEVVVMEKVRTKKKAVSDIVDTFMKDIEEYGYGGAIVHHINCPEEAEALANKIMKATGKQVMIGPIGPVIGVHVGPGAVGMAYFTERPRA